MFMHGGVDERSINMSLEPHCHHDLQTSASARGILANQTRRACFTMWIKTEHKHEHDNIFAGLQKGLLLQAELHHEHISVGANPFGPISPPCSRRMTCIQPLHATSSSLEPGPSFKCAAALVTMRGREHGLAHERDGEKRQKSPVRSARHLDHTFLDHNTNSTRQNPVQQPLCLRRPCAP